jgi:hypothetical protein
MNGQNTGFVLVDLYWIRVKLVYTNITDPFNPFHCSSSI